VWTPPGLMKLVKDTINMEGKYKNTQKYFFALAVFASTFFAVSSLNTSYALDCNLTGSAPTPGQIFCPFLRLFNLALVAGGVLLLIFIVIGAIKMSTALGDPKGLKASYDTWIYAFIGVFVILGTLAIFAILDRTFGLGLRHYIGLGGVNSIFDRISVAWESMLHDVFKIY
jgi:hypothetical protein